MYGGQERAPSIAPVSLAKTRGVTPPLFKAIWLRVKDFSDNRALWNKINPKHAFKLETPFGSCVLQTIGYSGADLGLALWHSYEDLSLMLKPEATGAQNPIDRTRLVFMLQPEKYCRADSAVAQQLQLPYPEPFCGKTCPAFLSGDGNGASLSDFRLLEAALAGILDIIKRLKPAAYAYEPLTITKRFKSGLGKDVEATLIYPAGNLPVGAEALGPMPGCCTRYVPIPPSLKGRYKDCSMEAAAAYYRGLMATLPASQVQHQAAKYALANALWKMETPENNREAIQLSTEVLKALPDDDFGARHFLLNAVLGSQCYDSNAWNAALDVLGMYPNEYSTEWMWSTALLRFRRDGAQSKRACEALRQAIRQNPHVLDMLTGSKPIPDRVDSYGYIMAAGAVVQGNQNWATRYCRNHAIFWKLTDGAMQWLNSVGKDVQQQEQASSSAPATAPGPIRAAGWWSSSMAASSMAGTAAQAGAAGAGVHLAQLNIPKGNGIACAGCGKGSSELKRCMGCKKVSYCGTECQRKHWKVHKPECVAAR